MRKKTPRTPTPERDDMIISKKQMKEINICLNCKNEFCKGECDFLKGAKKK